jgi:hypothetical protein
MNFYLPKHSILPMDCRAGTLCPVLKPAKHSIHRRNNLI